MDLRFLRLRRWLLKQQPNKTVFNRFIENQYQAVIHWKQSEGQPLRLAFYALG